MRIHSLLIKNYRPFAILEETRLGHLATIVGQNDAGKSSILRALQLFFEEKPKIANCDVHAGAGANDDLTIEVAFTSLPEKIELEDGVQTTIQEEMLTDHDGQLRIRKSCPCDDLSKLSITLITHDYDDDRFAGLALRKERELNELCKSVGIEASRSGRGITNKDKRLALRDKAKKDHVQLKTHEWQIATKDELWKRIASVLPEFVLFETDTKLGVGETTFQSQFRPIIKTASEQPTVDNARGLLTGAIRGALQAEVDKVYVRLKRHTDTLVGLTASPEFFWDKAVTFDILGKDQSGVETSLALRGSGLRRLLMVAFFHYLAERDKQTRGNFIFAVEEPENCLHPGLQRELVASFRHLADEGYQIIITSHSPVFAGASPPQDLALITRTGGVAKSSQTPNLDLSSVAEQLGVEPADQITGYSACVFVEGPDDIVFFTTVASTLKKAGELDANFEDKRIGFITCGGETLKHWINLRAMGRLNRHFAVVVDSDRESSHHNIPARKLNWKADCEKQGGRFFILRKREIENYIHPDAITRSRRERLAYDEFTDMKKLFGENVVKVIGDMSHKEILAMDYYRTDDAEHHELKEIVQALLSLPDGV